MTEKFIKLSDFLKLIGKEDEQEELAAAKTELAAEDEPAVSPAESEAAQPPDAEAEAPPNDAASDEANGAPDNEPPQPKEESGPEAEAKMSRDELKVILMQFGWEGQKQIVYRPRPEKKEEEPEPENIHEIFGGISQAVLSELFTDDELEELGEDKTQIFTGDDLKELSGVTGADTEEESHAADDRTALITPAAPSGGAAAVKKPDTAAAAPGGKRGGRRYRTGCLGGILYFIFVLSVSVALAAVGWLAANDVLSLNKPERIAEITVSEGESIDEIAQQLENAGIINYKRLFKLYAKLSRVEEKHKIDPGTYTLSSSLDYRAIVTGMQQYTGWTGSDDDIVTVLIPEGKTLVQTFEILDKAGVCSAEELKQCAAEHNFEYRFLSEDTLGDEKRLEGYLFPDTYEFYLNSSPEATITKLLDNFNNRVTGEMYDQAERIGYSMHDIITIASLIEMEAGADSERATIASVIYNRLNSNYYPYLEIDASLLYAFEERKTELTYEDKKVDSPYNTYTHEGLPPGAIANPGLASIRAALAPEETGYYFYALGKSGTHEFFSTYSQFEKFINSADFGG